MAITPTFKSLRPLALPSLLLAAGGAGAYLRSRFQRSRVFSPQRYPNGVWQPAEFGVPAEDVFFETDDGIRLHAWWVNSLHASV